MHTMNEREHMEIIARSEDPGVSFDDVAGRPPSVEDREWLEEFGDSLFDQCSLEDKVEELSDLPIEMAVRRIARQSESEQARILSRLPDELRSAIGSLLPASAA